MSPTGRLSRLFEWELFELSTVVFIVNFWVFLELLLDVLHLVSIDLPSTHCAPLRLRRLVRDLTSKLIFLFESLHVPVPVHAYQVEPVEALVDPHEISSRSERLHLKFLFIIAELLQAYGTPTLQGVIVL
jgi:hypothetical protein